MYQESKRTFWESLAINVLKMGRIPKHVGFIMDGNRRYAKNLKLMRKVGHAHGTETTMKVFEWCKDFGIDQVTVFAFSVENFKRSEEEVNDIMFLIQEKLTNLLESLDDLNAHGVRVRFYGELNMLPAEVQKVVAELSLQTCQNSKAYLNFCMPYTSRREITGATNKMLVGLRSGQIDSGDCTPQLFERLLYTYGCQDPDLIVRTSGEERLSDFLLWQGHMSVLTFVDALWPAFTFWNLCLCILHYQRHYPAAAKAKDDLQKSIEKSLPDKKMVSSDSASRISEFLSELNRNEINYFRQISTKSS